MILGVPLRKSGRYKLDYIKFLIYAHASCDETKEHLELLFETNSLSNKEKYNYFVADYIKLSKKINKFIQGVGMQHLTSNIAI